MGEFYELLLEQPEPEAKDIALALELFVSGSLNIFNNHTNVNVQARFVVYGTRDLGKELGAISTLVMLENISARIAENAKIGVTAGASAPEILIKQVIQRLQDWGASAPQELSGREENITFSLPKELRIPITQA